MDTKPSPEYFRRLGSCWPIERLQQAWDEATAPTPPTWAWFLGSRLREFDRADIVLRVQLAAAHVTAQRVRFPHAMVATVVRFVKYCPEDQIVPMCELLGHYLDDPDDSNAFVVLGQLLANTPAKPEKA